MKIEFNNLTDILNYMSARGWQFVTELNYDRHTLPSEEGCLFPGGGKNKDFDSIQTNSNSIAAYILTDRRIFIKKNQENTLKSTSQ